MQTFLAKDGKVFGPYNKEEMFRFHATGQIRDFFWIWDSSEETWKPLENPPAPPSIQAFDRVQLEAVCFNQQARVAGLLSQVTDHGAELIIGTSSKEGSLLGFGPSYPALPGRCDARINVFDPNTGLTKTFWVELKGLSRRGSDWVYRLEWKSEVMTDFSSNLGASHINSHLNNTVSRKEVSL